MLGDGPVKIEGETKEELEARAAKKAHELNTLLNEYEQNNYRMKAGIWHRDWVENIARYEKSKLPGIEYLWVWVTLPRADSPAFEAFVSTVNSLGVELKLLSKNGEKVTREYVEGDGGTDSLFIPWSAGPVFRVMESDG